MLPQNRKEVRILLVGDSSVGKTSLILSLVSEEFHSDVPPRAEEITIPGDLTPEKVPTCIVDYSAVEQNDSMLEMEIRRADVVAIVYAVDDEDTLDSVTDHWLPFMQRTLGEGHSTPVILVGNKVDLVDYSTMEDVFPIMNAYEEVESCVECSAKNLKNISEMFYFAQKSVLHPSAPLWNYHEKDLTEKCKKALIRIFKICDMDNDGFLSDYELGQFQRRCFHMDLESGTLDSLKAVVHKNCSDGISDQGLTSKGFMSLQGLFIQRGRHETTWTILRNFGYDDDLSLHRDFLHQSLAVPLGSTVELSNDGYDFFSALFDKFDKDQDKALSPQELVNLFSTCPVMPWGPDVYNTALTNENGYLSLPGYLGLWTLNTLLDYQRTMEYLAYLGYSYNSDNDNQLCALQVTRNKKIDLAKRQTSRNVFRCHVIGPKGAGKTTFCQALLGRTRQDIASIRLEDFPRHTINTINVYGQEKYLVLEDIDVRNIADSLMPSEVNCDVCCLVYDGTNARSFEFVARIYLKYYANSKIPVLIVSNKSELPSVRQDYIIQPDAFCSKHQLPPIQPMSAERATKKDIFVKLATMAAFPRFQAAWRIFYHGSHFRHLGLSVEDSSLFKFGIGLALAALGGILIMRYMQRN